MLKINTLGKILSGDEIGNFIKIIDDTQETGGFLILTSQFPDMSEGHDGWVDSEPSLQKYFLESNWEIDWNIEK